MGQVKNNLNACIVQPIVGKMFMMLINTVFMNMTTINGNSGQYMLLQFKQDLNGIFIVKIVKSNPLLPPKNPKGSIKC